MGDSGRVDLRLQQQMLSDAYFADPAPKSTGREYFNMAWLEKQQTRGHEISPVDVQATLTELTAVSIAEQVQLTGGYDRLMVCGGGARNPLLMARLSAMLPGTEVCTTDAFGISGDNMEALAFSTLSGQPRNRARCDISGGFPPILMRSRFYLNVPRQRAWYITERD